MNYLSIYLSSISVLREIVFASAKPRFPIKVMSRFVHGQIDANFHVKLDFSISAVAVSLLQSIL